MRYNLPCPSCGGALAGIGRSRILSCPYCEVSLLVQAPTPASGPAAEHVPRYAVPAITKHRAAEAVRRMFRTPRLSRALPRRVTAQEGTLWYVPFYEFHGRRMGMGAEEASGVSVEEFSRILPALHLGSWGLEHGALLGKSGAAPTALRPFDETALWVRGTVLEPQLSSREARKIFTEARSLRNLTLDGRREIVEAQVSLLYYPIWVFRYEYLRKTYAVYVDGRRGALLRGRAPRKESHRVAALIAMAAALALPVAKALRAALAAVAPSSFFPLRGLVAAEPGPALGAAAVLAGGLLVLAAGWNLFRTSQEFVFSPRGLVAHVTRRPPRTPLERALERLNRLAAPLFRHGGKPQRGAPQEKVSANLFKLFIMGLQGTPRP